MALSHCQQNFEIERYDASDLTMQDFEDRFLKPGTPVILEKLIASLPLSRWTIEYLLKVVGNNAITVRGKTHLQQYKTGVAYNVRQTTFKKYVEDIKRQTQRGLSSYMAVQNIKKVFPELQEECCLPNCIGKLHNGPFLWVGHKGHYEYCHYDPDASMLMMVEGRKQVRLFSCNDLENLYPNPLGSKGKTIQSQVDCDSPDLNRFPKFSQSVCYHQVLKPGDSLFIPAFWWHQVTSLTDSVSVNAFFGDSGKDQYITRITKTPVFPAFKYWLLNVVEQNRPFMSFQRTLERLPMCVANFVLKHFHDVAENDVIELLLVEILGYLQVESLPKFKGGGKHPPPLKIRGLRWR